MSEYPPTLQGRQTGAREVPRGIPAGESDWVDDLEPTPEQDAELAALVRDTLRHVRIDHACPCPVDHGDPEDDE